MTDNYELHRGCDTERPWLVEISVLLYRYLALMSNLTILICSGPRQLMAVCPSWLEIPLVVQDQILKKSSILLITQPDGIQDA